jgi:acyl-CoA synthetase (AMP-forming)/AMP-acid ligase II
VLAIMLPNRVELITSMFAAWRLGAAVTPEVLPKNAIGKIAKPMLRERPRAYRSTRMAHDSP